MPDGELGDGTTINRSSPVQVLNVSNIVAVSGGDDHSSALAADGTVWKWGLNDLGELGNGTTNAVANPFPAKILVDMLRQRFQQRGHGRRARLPQHRRQGGRLGLDVGREQPGPMRQRHHECHLVADTCFRPRRPGRVALEPGSSRQPGYANLAWSSTTGAYFSVEYTTNLSAGFAGVLQSNILATPPTNLVTVPVPDVQGYYRLKF
jgi:hypothetical protein